MYIDGKGLSVSARESRSQFLQHVQHGHCNVTSRRLASALVRLQAEFVSLKYSNAKLPTTPAMTLAFRYPGFRLCFHTAVQTRSLGVVVFPFVRYTLLVTLRCCAHLVQPLQRAQAQRQPLRSTSDADEACDGAILALLFYAQVGESILPCAWLAKRETDPCRMRNVPNTLLA